MILFPSRALFALEIGGGPAVWYAWWQPAFEKAFTSASNYSTTQRFFYMYPSFLVGGVVTAHLAERWNFNATYLYSGWYEADTTNLKIGSPNISYNSARLESNKHDFDSTLSYSLTDFFKLFIGFKYQGYSFKFRNLNLDATALTFDQPGRGILEQQSYGPGAGIGFTIDIGQGFYLLLNGSANYMRGKFQNPTSGNPHKLWEHYNIYGTNASAAIAYVVHDANVTISLGFRYQYLYYHWDGAATSDLIRDVPGYNIPPVLVGEHDQFYGLTLSAVYSFRLH